MGKGCWGGLGAQMEQGSRERSGLPAVLGPPGPGSLGGSGRRPACSSSREGGRLQGGAGLARPPGDAAAAALRPGSAGCCGSGTPEAEALGQ